MIFHENISSFYIPSKKINSFYIFMDTHFVNAYSWPPKILLGCPSYTQTIEY